MNVWLSQFEQFIANWAAGLGHPTEIFLRLIAATLMGALVGFEREIRGRQAGFRTYIIVCLGSALVMVVSSQLALQPWPLQHGEEVVRVDPGRIAYGVMTGIGFLGAGVIIKSSRGGIRGLTTAAGLWAIAAVGLGMGLGMYVVSAFATGLILLALWVLDYLEDAIPKTRYREVILRRVYEPGVVASTVAQCKAAGLRIIDAGFERSLDLKSADISLLIAFKDKQQYFNFERELEGSTQYTLLATHEL